MSILSSTNSGRFGLRIPTRNYFIEVARDCLPLKSANLRFIPGQSDYELYAQNTLDLEQRGNQFVLVASLEDFVVAQTVFKHEKCNWFEFSSVYKTLDTKMLSRISKIIVKSDSGKELLVNPLYKKIDFTNERAPFVDEVQNGMRFSGCAIKNIDKTNTPKNCKILEFVNYADVKAYTTAQTINGLDIEYLLAYISAGYDSLDMPLLGIKNCTKLKQVNITQAMLYYDDRLCFDRNTPVYDPQDFNYISKEKSVLINQFVQQNALNPKALYYCTKNGGYVSPLIWDQEKEEYFIDKAHENIS